MKLMLQNWFTKFVIKKGFLMAGLMLMSSAAFAQANSFTPQQQKDIQKIVHDYLVANPQVLVEAATALQNQQQAQWQQTANKIVPQLSQALFATPQSPVVGNPHAELTMVEFLDYQCPHCKEMAPQVEQIINTNKKIKVIYKILPIFGDNSLFAAKAAMASQAQGKFQAFHNALLAAQGTLTTDKTLAIAKQVGLNTDQLQKDMNNPAFMDEMKQNYQLAKQLNLTGTPAFVLAQVQIDPKTHKITRLKNPLLIPGAVENGILSQAISQVSGSGN